MFISYRRDDSPGHGTPADRLTIELGRDAVFMDVDAINAGDDFLDRIERAIQASATFLAVIGPEWNTARLGQPNDVVRFELMAAMSSRVPIIPVLVDGAPPPTADELPRELRDLACRNAVALDDVRWASDITRLVKDIEARGPRARCEIAASRSSPLRSGSSLRSRCSRCSCGPTTARTTRSATSRCTTRSSWTATPLRSCSVPAVRERVRARRRNVHGGDAVDPRPTRHPRARLSVTPLCASSRLSNVAGATDLSTSAIEATVVWVTIPEADSQFGHSMVGLRCRSAGGADAADGYSGVVTDTG